MNISDYIEPAWNDDEMPLGEGDRRKTRIGELLKAVAAMRPCRRHGDHELLTQLQAELILLLDADLIQAQQTTGRAS
jgi:hypothetical protein